MKVTMYELLGMVKDGKIPKKIKYDNDIWEYIEEKENYIKSNGASLNWDYVALYCLKEPVEILEEPKGIPKKLKSLNNVGNVPNLVEFADKQQLNNHLLKDKLNEVIHYLQYLKSKGE